MSIDVIIACVGAAVFAITLIAVMETFRSRSDNDG